MNIMHVKHVFPDRGRSPLFSFGVVLDGRKTEWVSSYARRLTSPRGRRYSSGMKPPYRRMLRKMSARADQPSQDAAQRVFWSLYILECRDGSFYTGVTTDVNRRLRQHQEGTASRYTRTHRPVVLVYREECGSRARALSRECAVKSLSRGRKEELILEAKPARSSCGVCRKTKKRS